MKCRFSHVNKAAVVSNFPAVLFGITVCIGSLPPEGISLRLPGTTPPSVRINSSLGWPEGCFYHLHAANLAQIQGVCQIATLYKHNVWPMQCLAELRPRWTGEPVDALPVQARLLGISGLLPLELTSSQTSLDGYLRRVWDSWWRERDGFSDCLLPKALWRFHGLRPANHPQRRLALASRWSVEGDLAVKLARWCARPVPDRELASSLLETLQVDVDDFWSWHWTFSSARFKKAQPLLGGGRVTDLAVNVILPWLWIRAVEGKNETAQRVVEHRYFAWPVAGDNSLLRLARQRLLGGASPRLLVTAAAQQGLIQIVRDFCEHSNAVCDNCKFPAMVRELLFAECK